MSAALITALQPKLFLSLTCVLNMIPYWLLRRDMRGPLARMLNQATLMIGVGLPMLVFRDWLPRVPTLILGNMLILAAITLLWQVVAGLHNRQGPPALVLRAPLAWLSCWMWPDFRTETDLRIAVAAGLCILLVLLPVIDLLRVGSRGMAHALLAATGILYVMMNAGRIGLAVTHSAIAESPAWSTAYRLDTLVYIMVWPALCTVLLFRRSLAAEEERGRRDELSGLLNRRGMLLELDRIGPATLLLFDIDHFKRINDQFGHASGDDAIIAFARTAAQVMGPGLPLGRIGGEEFVALVPCRAHPDGSACTETDAVSREAMGLADRIRSSFAATVLPVGLSLTVSIGVAGFQAGEAADMWLARADRALYRAKRGGRNRIESCDGRPAEQGRGASTAEESRAVVADPARAAA